MVQWLTWMIGAISLVLSGVHVYWLLGGRRGIQVAVPSWRGEPLFRPSKMATAVVATLLTAMGVFVFQLGGFGRSMFTGWQFWYGGWGIGLLFILRAIGDFKWLGFFKRKKGTLFAHWDSILYAPLCLFMGIGIIVITIT